MTFAEQLKEARKDAGISQQTLADITGIPKRTIESWEVEGKKGRDPAEWCQRLVLGEIDRVKHAADFERLYDYLMKNERSDEQIRKSAGLDTYPSIIIERIVKDIKRGRE